MGEPSTENLICQQFDGTTDEQDALIHLIRKLKIYVNRIKFACDWTELNLSYVRRYHLHIQWIYLPHLKHQNSQKSGIEFILFELAYINWKRERARATHNLPRIN